MLTYTHNLALFPRQPGIYSEIPSQKSNDVKHNSSLEHLLSTSKASGFILSTQPQTQREKEEGWKSSPASDWNHSILLSLCSSLMPKASTLQNSLSLCLPSSHPALARDRPNPLSTLMLLPSDTDTREGSSLLEDTPKVSKVPATDPTTTPPRF